MGIIVRTLNERDLGGWMESMRTAFLAHAAEGEAEERRVGMDLDRSWGAFDGDNVVGTLRSFPTVLTVPGPAELATAAVTNATVVPTHRRRGLLTQMITADLEASAQRGEALSILIASEYPIYGRFGYGPAIEAASYSFDVSHAHFRTAASGTIELVDRPTVRKEAPALYEVFRAQQPGAISRDDRWWDRVGGQGAGAAAGPTDPPTGYQAIYQNADGTPEGYVRYRAENKWELMRPAGRLTIDELVALTPAAYHRLWQYCCDVDLITSIDARDRSIDEPLVWLLTDGRVIRQTGRFDFVWVRILDAMVALSTRRYLTEGEVVLDVVDPLRLASGRYLLTGGPADASCSKTRRSPDISVGVDALGSVYLGGARLQTLAFAGRVDEHRPGALAVADRMFRSTVVPWCTTWF